MMMRRLSEGIGAQGVGDRDCDTTVLAVAPSDGVLGSTTQRLRLGAVLVVLGVAATVLVGARPDVVPSPPPSLGANSPAFVAPSPEVDEPTAPSGRQETAVLAGGCFWGVQGVFEHVKGVTRAESGYAGGAPATAHYEVVSTGVTRHAESVRITYDPAQVTFGQLLRIYFSVVTDPTELNRQGPDLGSQYRSAIFAQDSTQQRIAFAYLAQLTARGVFDAPIVTTIEPNTRFFPAEDYHQDFLISHPSNLYILVNDTPKVDALERVFPDSYSEQPVLTNATR